MVLGWAFCFPAGILFARFSSSFKDLGFPAHRLLQTLGSALVIAGFITAIVFTEDNGIGESSRSLHSIGRVRSPTKYIHASEKDTGNSGVLLRRFCCKNIDVS